MICQFGKEIKWLKEILKMPLTTIYQRLQSAVRARKLRFFMPSSGRHSTADGYILWGYYTRERIIDKQPELQEDGTWEYVDIEIKDFQIQRIMDKRTGRTHAVLCELLVPYKQYSLRYILYHLYQYFSQAVTQEAYCLNEDIEVKTFTLWLKWLKNHISILDALGLTENYTDNRKMLGQWIRELAGDVIEWTYRSLRTVNRALFQERRMPANTMYQSYVRTR